MASVFFVVLSGVLLLLTLAGGIMYLCRKEENDG